MNGEGNGGFPVSEIAAGTLLVSPFDIGDIFEPDIRFDQKVLQGKYIVLFTVDRHRIETLFSFDETDGDILVLCHDHFGDRFEIHPVLLCLERVDLYIDRTLIPSKDLYITDGRVTQQCRLDERISYLSDLVETDSITFGTERYDIHRQGKIPGRIDGRVQPRRYLGPDNIQCIGDIDRSFVETFLVTELHGNDREVRYIDRTDIGHEAKACHLLLNGFGDRAGRYLSRSSGYRGDHHDLGRVGIGKEVLGHRRQSDHTHHEKTCDQSIEQIGTLIEKIKHALIL